MVALAALGGFPDLAAAEAPAWVGPTKLVLDPILLYFEVAFVARIILSWYPKVRETMVVGRVSCRLFPDADEGMKMRADSSFFGSRGRFRSPVFRCFSGFVCVI